MMLRLILELPVSGFHHHRSFFNVGIFNSFAKSNQSPCPAATFRRHEGDKCQSIPGKWNNKEVLRLSCSVLGL